jgi:hypothetical protein
MWKILTAALLLSPAAAQAQSDMGGMDMSGMDMGHHDMAHMDMPGMSSGVLGSYPMTRDASGTSWQPDTAQHQMMMTMAGDWMLMGHMTLWGIYDSQSGPRGDDKTFLAGMLMGMARRDFGASDTLQFRAMLSPDPFMGKSGYPLLFATGETANGTTHLIDRQHPHDLFMELSGTYAHKFGGDESVFLYAGYPGEPALGPPAFMHRASGMDIPDAPITHHWFDSTHITFGVVTAGFVSGDWKIEASQFTGREPDQHRYDFDTPKFDSTAVRLSWNPSANWSMQASWGYLKSPEELEPDLTENRFTASATYVKPFESGGSFAATVGWGLKDESDGTQLNGLFAEAEYKPADLWTLFTRAEWVQNSELDALDRKLEASQITMGGIKDWRVAEHWKFGIGALYAFDFAPHAVPGYGGNPHGTMAFVRVVAE